MEHLGICEPEQAFWAKIREAVGDYRSMFKTTA